MLILGIETSCDETGVALFDSEKGLLADDLHSQVDMHRLYGGVVPELASRDHIRRIIPLIDDIIKRAGVSRKDIDAVAVTEGPGLAGALLVGTSVAYAVGAALGIPVIGIHHMEGHLLSCLLSGHPPKFPFVALLVSGGHTQLLYVKAPRDYELLGETLDDAAGEAFDKTAQILGEAYPGGPIISKFAEKGTPGKIVLPRPLLNSGNLDFSFSGLKTAVVNVYHKAPKPITEQIKYDLARAFVLVHKTEKALKQTGAKALVVAGGVSANSQLREALTKMCKKRNCEIYFPPSRLCTDNGAMIAAAAAFHLDHLKDFMAPAGFSIKPRWQLTEDVKS
ncbi:MAG: tRNA (adenosine(37)-N6)-threonylcarbamoyltransferase complex transferase subunit TsaD [Burkholderiales bacterium]|nr:tRNA (adenosine(37)-N6)-threonylcarbamoyltransferase complex transferase subunit TsaD [Burkholderiales bacterium]